MINDSASIFGMKDTIRFALEPPTLRYIKEFQEQQDWLKNIVEPPMLKHLRDFHRYQYDWLKNVVEPPFLKYQKEFQRQQVQWKKVIDFPFQTLAANFFQASEMRKALESPIANIVKQFQSQKLTFPVTPMFMSLQSIHKLSADYQKNFDAQKYLNLVNQAFPERFATVLLNRMEAVHEELISTTSDPESILAEEIKVIAELLLEQCRKLPNSLISFEAMIGYTIAILTFLYCLHAGNVTEEKIMNILLTDKAEVLQAVSALRPPINNKKHYIVDRMVSLRIKPLSNSSRFGVLYPNQKVTLLKNGKKWLYVEYFDYSEGIPKCGWVYKKYLHLLR